MQQIQHNLQFNKSWLELEGGSGWEVIDFEAYSDM